MEEGADGISLDVEITEDGQLIIMRDDRVDRTINCTGCVSEMTFAEVRACRLLDGEGAVTEEAPPTLEEAYEAVGASALMDVELKVFGESCLTDTTGPEQLTLAVLAEVTRIRGENQTIFSSFQPTVVERVKTERSGHYSALLSVVAMPALVDQAVLLGPNAIHPVFAVTAETVEAALEACRSMYGR